MKKLLSKLSIQVLIAILLGIAVGLYFKGFAPTAQLINKIFISMVTMLIGPIIFLTIVLGIAGMSDMKKVGRVGGKALLYFEIVTSFALIIGVVVANVVKPGDSFVMVNAADASKLAVYQKAAAEMHWVDFLVHIVPATVFDAFAKGDILILHKLLQMGVPTNVFPQIAVPRYEEFEKSSKFLLLTDRSSNHNYVNLY